MTRHRSSQLEQIREIARSREQSLALEVGELMRQRAAEEQTLARLGGYLDEYASTPGGGARLLREVENERRFVERLGKAVLQQRVQVERLAERTRLATQRWQVARAEVEALSRLHERREQERQAVTARREQRDADERGTRQGNKLLEVFQ